MNTEFRLMNDDEVLVILVIQERNTGKTVSSNYLYNVNGLDTIMHDNLNIEFNI